jgi:F0F1-type ATP synthase delta subunit
MEPSKKKPFSLPVSVINQHDVSKLITELEGVENFFMQVKTRRAGDSVALPKTTPFMQDLLEANELNLLKAEDREKLKYVLQTVRTKAPSVHMSFTTDPDREFTEKIVSWLRQNIHPMLLLNIGVQPNIGAGFMLRTTNHVYDFSLRQHLVKKSEDLITRLNTGVTL